MPTQTGDIGLMLSLIRQLSTALSNSDVSASEINRKLIQESLDLLARHNTDEPTFPD